MSWAAPYIEELRCGASVTFRPRGRSMEPKIKSGQLCRVAPVREDQLEAGDVVLCRVRGADYLHHVIAIRAGQYQIGNARGHINGWIMFSAIFGRLDRVDP